MIILALETSAIGGSVALLQEGSLLAQKGLPAGSRSAQTLAPTVAAMLQECQISLSATDCVAVTAGPGSFTGLRVGVTTAKTLAYAWSCHLLGIDTLEVIAEQALAATTQSASGILEIHAVLDAQRQELFVARFELLQEGLNPVKNGQILKRLGPAEIIPAEAWLANLTDCTLVSGPGLARWAAKIPAGVPVAAPENWEPQAATVGKLAYRAFLAGRRDDPMQLLPVYIRPSAAEEKRAAKEIV